MKVFTVGLDQKPPMEKQPEGPAEVVSVAPGTPPPIYPSDLVRRKKPYKSILLCMLGVFLLMLFVLTLSEMAYNRERDQNFLRLRWAELKHRMGYYDSYNNGIADRLSAHRIRPVEAFNQVDSTTPTTTSTEAPTTKVPEVDPSNDDEPSSMDARLGFLRSILSKIKEKAEELGMDGTMQVSLIQVEPEGMTQNNEFFKDGFGEVAHPNFLHNNDATEHEERPMFGPWITESAYGRNAEFPDMFNQQSRSGFGGNQEWNRFAHPFEGGHDFEGRQPMSQFMGEVYGRRFGRLLQELLTRRMNNFQGMSPINENAQFDPRFGQQFFWPGPWQQQEQQPQWWWNQPQVQAQPQSQPQQWWPQQQPWTFDSQQPQRLQNHPEQQQLPPMIAMPQENQWGQQQQMLQGVPQIHQGNQMFQQQAQQPSVLPFQVFGQQNFGQQNQQLANQNQNQQQQSQSSFLQVPFINPAENIQIDPPQQQKPTNEEWKPWGQEARAWTHQNADQSADQSVPQAPQIQPEVSAWQVPQSQPSLEPSSEFKMPSFQEFPEVSSESAVPSVETDSNSDSPSEPVEPFTDTDALARQLDENSINDENMHTIAPEAELTEDKKDQSVPSDSGKPETDDSESHLNTLPELELQAPFDASSGNLHALNDAILPKTSDDSNNFKIDFPAVKFPVNDELNQQNQMNPHIDPRFFQIDEPQADQSESI